MKTVTYDETKFRLVREPWRYLVEAGVSPSEAKRRCPPRYPPSPDFSDYVGEVQQVGVVYSYPGNGTLTRVIDGRHVIVGRSRALFDTST